MKDFWEAKKLLEAATPENPVKLRVKDGCGQHVDVLVTDATVDIKMSDELVEQSDDADQEVQIDMVTDYEMKDNPYYDPYWDGDGEYGS